MMTRTHLLFALLLLVSGAAPSDDPDALLRAGNDAYARGDYAQAIDQFQLAAQRTTDPTLVAFSLASAKYRLALKSADGRAANLREAEELFRCSLDGNDPRRARALNGLGACLLRQALDGDDRRAADAVKHLEQCLTHTDLDDDLTADARHNLALARLVLAQTTRPTTSSSQENPPNPEEERKDRPRPKDRAQRVEGDRNRKGERMGKPDTGTKTIDGPNEGQRPGGEKTEAQPGGNHPRTSPEGPSPYSADATHLDEALERIREKHRSAKTSAAGIPAKGVKDW
jgi:tetratricopeptide (TPR) repeat protein